MSSKNNTLAVDKSVMEEARRLVAEHPHFMGIGVGAVAAAISHFYYDNQLLTTAAVFIGGIVVGEVLSRVVASARQIEEAAAMGREAVKNLAAAGKRADEAAAKAADLEQQLIAAARILTVNGEEIAALRKEMAEEARKAEAFRTEVRAAKAAAATPAPAAPVIAPTVVEGEEPKKKAPRTRKAA